MKLRGRLKEISQDLLTKEQSITLVVEGLTPGIERFREEDLAITIEKWREQRSLTANAYYWVLVGKIAEHTNLPQPVTHNILLRRYGTLDIMDGDPMIIMVPDTEEAEKDALAEMRHHLKPTSHTLEGKTGKMYRAYQVIKGSSELDSKEFSVLLDGAISECKEMGIETLPKEEIERMMEAYEKHHSR